MWQKVAAGAVLGAAATKLLLSARADTPPSSRPSYSAQSVTFAADTLRKPNSEADGAALLPAAAAATAGGAQQQAGSWRQWRWVVEAQLLALQVVLAAVATVTADRLHGRSLAMHVLLASAFLIGGLALVSVIAAGVSAAWQAWQQPRWGPNQAMRATALGEALLAEMGGLKVAMAEAAPVAPPVAQNFSGTWEKDRAASDSLDPAISAMRLNVLLRRAVGLVRGLEIKQDDQEFDMAVYSVVPWFKVIERYPLSGEERQFKRRDLRRGKHVGHAEVLADGRIRLHVAWKDPIGGHGHDTFSSPAAGVLHVDTLMMTREQTLEYRTIYHRRQH